MRAAPTSVAHSYQANWGASRGSAAAICSPPALGYGSMMTGAPLTLYNSLTRSASNASSRSTESNVRAIFVRADGLQLRAYRQSACLCLHRHARPRARPGRPKTWDGARSPTSSTSPMSGTSPRTPMPATTRWRRRRRRAARRSGISPRTTPRRSSRTWPISIYARRRRWAVATDHIGEMIDFAATDRAQATATNSTAGFISTSPPCQITAGSRARRTMSARAGSIPSRGSGTRRISRSGARRSPARTGRWNGSRPGAAAHRAGISNAR